MKIEFDHVGILVTDVDRALESLRSNNWPVDEIETFPSEGTREVYIGPGSASGRLLLIEPIGAGPYRGALAKRGPGLHHIALNVDDAMAFIERVSGSGWYLHPQSLRTFENHGTLWLARPDVPVLLEVVQHKSMTGSERTAFIDRIEVPLPEHKPSMASAVGLAQFQRALEPGVFMTVGGERRSLEEFVDVS